MICPGITSHFGSFREYRGSSQVQPTWTVCLGAGCIRKPPGRDSSRPMAKVRGFHYFVPTSTRLGGSLYSINLNNGIHLLWIPPHGNQPFSRTLGSLGRWLLYPSWRRLLSLPVTCCDLCTNNAVRIGGWLHVHSLS